MMDLTMRGKRRRTFTIPNQSLSSLLRSSFPLSVQPRFSYEGLRISRLYILEQMAEYLVREIEGENCNRTRKLQNGLLP